VETPPRGLVLNPGSQQEKELMGKKKLKIRPLHDRVIIRRTEEERTSPGGIVIPDSATEKPIRGEVTAVGNGKILYSGTEVKVEGEDLLVMREEDIMAVIDK
jgi:chaperonin GroES